MAVAALLALGMLAIISGMIADSALTKSTNQVPNVATQASFAYCAYQSGWLSDQGQFRGCMVDILIPTEAALIGNVILGDRITRRGESLVEEGRRWRDREIINRGKSLIRWGTRLMMGSGVGALAFVA
jgi:hypothetical protein